MGIDGLLLYLKPVTKKVHLSDLSGKKCAVDGFCWLHRSVFALPANFADGEYSTTFIKFCEGRIDLLLSFNITPVIVFDGNYLPLKQKENDEREKSRISNYEKGKKCQEDGDSKRARTYLLASVKISLRMIHDFVEILKLRGIQYIFAPYEADPELYYLVKNKFVDFIITEDSDSLVYGCDQVLFKLSKDGTGDLIKYEDVLEFIKPMTKTEFQYFCIISGCDFFSLPGIGIKKAHKMVTSKPDKDSLLKSMKEKRDRDNFEKALNTFNHQSIIDPLTFICKPLNPYTPLDGVNYDYLGKILDPDTAKKVALFIVDSKSKRPVDEVIKDQITKKSDIPTQPNDVDDATHHDDNNINFNSNNNHTTTTTNNNNNISTPSPPDDDITSIIDGIKRISVDDTKISNTVDTSISTHTKHNKRASGAITSPIQTIKHDRNNNLIEIPSSSQIYTIPYHHINDPSTNTCNVFCAYQNQPTIGTTHNYHNMDDHINHNLYTQNIFSYGYSKPRKPVNFSMNFTALQTYI